MRKSQSLQLYTLVFLCLSAFTSAWPWPRFLPEIDSLIVRKDGGDNGGNGGSAAPTSAAPSAAQTSAPSPKETGSSAGKSKTAAPASGSGAAASSSETTHASKKESETSSNEKPTTTYQTSYDPVLPAGGVSMLTPAAISGAQYYKIGDFVTFAWNYTSVLGSPTAIDIVATCTANDQLYTLAMNQTVSNETQALTWDTAAYQTGNSDAPLLTDTYTLVIYDAAGSISAQARPGYLAPFNQFTFGMYTGQPYAGVGQGFQCATCSGALSDMERKGLGLMLGMGLITVLSFTWFLGGIDVIW